MNLPLKGQLKQVYVKPQAKKSQKRRSEQLSESEWKNLMGMGMPTYRRHRGSVRQR